MGDERAATYLRLLAEAETRRPGRGSGPDIARSVEQVRWAGDILVTAGLLEEADVRRAAAEREAALLARSDMDRSRLARRMDWVLGELTELAGTELAGTELTGTGPAERAARPGMDPEQPMWITPVGRRIGVIHDRAPSDLHLMTLVRSPGGVTITAAIRMRWPPDGSSADLEITGAGPQHLPYDQLWAADDRGTRYRIGMGGEGGTLTWQGTLGLLGELPPDARWLDLIADGTHRLARIDLTARQEARPATAGEQAPVIQPGERILAAAAEHILASAWDPSGPHGPARLGETITMLAEAGALAPDSPAPGHLAALCQRLGVRGHGITAPPAAQIPARWAEVLPPAGPAGPAGPAAPRSSADPPGPEWFAPAGPAAADTDGTRFAFAGLTWAAGKSILHVVAAGPPPRPAPHWYAGWSWWVRDGAGGWHLAAETDPDPHTGGLASGPGTIAFRLRLTPPLPARPDAIEVEVTGWRGSARTVVPVGPDMPDT